ncbi:hypothetical protein [Bacillus solitudinis]|uniref:hypothetical protein n=1 Tax=Bacillus solitudinis TaxID=2014074 RepID=UPI000C234A25|nr:hypothetical protein [Bacillus solitudinis]
MSQSGLRGLASGILITTVICGSALYFDEAPVSESLSSAEMIIELENIGYSVKIEKEDSVEQEELIEEPVVETPEIEEDLPDNVQAETVTVYTMVLTVTSGMTSTNVAHQLMQGHIITSEEEFLDYIQTTNRSQSIRTGEFILRSDMSIQEIAEIIS